MEKNRFDGIWGNGAFKNKIKGNVYINFYNNSRYGKGTITFENENFVLTSSHSHCKFLGTLFRSETVNYAINSCFPIIFNSGIHCILSVFLVSLGMRITVSRLANCTNTV